MKKIILSLCMVLALTACKDQKKTQAQEKPVFKIGVILPLTGANTYMGSQMREGYEFVKEYENPDINYELIYFDDQQQPAKAAIGAKKLIEVDKVDALLTGTSQTAAVVADMAESAKIIHLGISSDTRFAQKNYNYTMAPDVADEAAVILKYMQEQGYRNLALISSNEMYANLVQENVSKYAPEYDIALTFNEKFTPGSTDYRILLHKAAQTNPDIFLLQAWMPEIDILTRQLLEIIPDAKITSLYAFFISPTPELYKGRFCLNVGSENEAFKKAFYEKYGKHIEQMSSTTYAQLSLMLDILKNKNTDLSQIIKQHDSIFGKLSLDGHAIRYLPIVETLE